MQYRLVVHPSAEIVAFQKEVTLHLNHGWVCVGGVSAVTDSLDKTVLLQAMVHP